MNQHEILVQELSVDPLGYGYATMSDQERYGKLLSTITFSWYFRR